MRPDFDVDLEPELVAAMAEHREEVEAIATGPWPPTFADTIAALERAGERLYLAERLLDDASLARSTAAIRALDAKIRPRLAAHRDAVELDPRLFARIGDLVARREELGLGEEERCVLQRCHRDLVRAGATLGGGDQVRLRAINERVAMLTVEFRRRLHEETRALAVHVGDADELDGLSPAMVAAAGRAAREHAEQGSTEHGFRLTLALPSAQPAHEYLHDRALRERLWHASVARGRRGGDNDNRAVVAEIAALRAERAGLLGFATHAEYAIADETAGSVAAVHRLLEEVSSAAVTFARAEAARHEAALRADGHEGPVAPWDWPYYAARERREQHAIDEVRLREHFQLDRVLGDGAFDIAERLYGLRFELCDDSVARPHPDVRIWDVRDADGSDRGRLYVDPYARDGKGGGAWLDAYAEPAPLLDRLPQIVLQLNITRPADGAPALLTPLDLHMLFHEFGHALHMLLSDVAHPRIAGLNVATDVVEFPSKLHESLGLRPEVIARYARHHETGAALDDADVAALASSTRVGAAAMGVRGAGNAWVDQAWHALAPGESVTDVDAFEAAVLERHGLDVPGLEPHYRSTYCVHIFDGGYGGVHYSYLWSAMLEAAALEWLDEHGGLTRANGQRLRDELLSRGATVDPLVALRTVTGREPSVQSMLRRRGLVAAE